MRFRLHGLICAALLSTPAALTAAPSAYFGLTVIDPVAETRTPNSYIVVDSDRIVAMGTGAPPASISASNRHDYSGRFAIPGLFDTHAHISIGPLRGRNVDGATVIDSSGNDSITRHAALMLLAHGITTIRDPGGETRRMVDYREAVEAGDLTGPEARVAGEIIHRSPFAVEGLITPITDTVEIEELVRRQAEMGVDFVKLYEGLTPADLAAGIEAARQAGVGTIAHLSDVSWTQAAELGIDALVHAIPISPDLLPSDRRAAYLQSRRPASYPFFEWFEQVDLDGPEIREMIRAVAQRGIRFDATMVAFHVAFWGDVRSVRDRDLPAAHPAFADNWQNRFRFDLGWQATDYARAKSVWPKVLRLVRMLHEAGVPMTIGTDMNNPFVAPGASFARELELHAQAGISNWAVLRMATSEGARSLGMDQRTGRLLEGLEADVVFLAADPSLDLAAAAQPVGVLTNGRFHDPAALRAQAIAVAGDVQAADCGDMCTPDSTIAALYEGVSAAPGTGWDRARLRGLFHPNAQLVTAAPGTGSGLTSSSIDELADGMERHFRATGFVEGEYRREVRMFGDFASVYSSFHAQAGGAEGAPARGLNHFQLLRRDGRWRIVSNVSVMEDARWTLPASFAP